MFAHTRLCRLCRASLIRATRPSPRQELRQLLQPPAAVRQTLEAVHLLLEGADAAAVGTLPRAKEQGVPDAGQPPPTREVADASVCGSPGRSGSVRDAARERGSPAGGGSVGSKVAHRATSRGWDCIRAVVRKDLVLRVQRFDAARVPEATCAQARAALPTGPNALRIVTNGSKACAPLFNWSSAQLDLAAALRLAAPIVAELRDLDQEIERLRRRQQALSTELECLQVELREIDVEAATLQAELREMEQCQY